MLLQAVAIAALALIAPTQSQAAVSSADAIRAVQLSKLGRALAVEHPGGTLIAARSGTAWTVTMHVAGRATPVATFTVDATTGKLLGGARLPDFPRHTSAQVIAIARASPKVHDWLSRYGTTTTIVDEDATAGTFTVHFDAGNHGEVAQAVVDDSTGKVTAAWTGPQVAWTMARGYHYAFGRRINDPSIWIGLCVVFLIGLLDFRRLRSWRTLDLLMLLAPSISLAYFNSGLIFWSVPLVYPPLAYLLGRLVWIGLRSERRPAVAGSLPIWILAGAAIFLIGFRGGLDRYDSNVIDVGYAGVVGADRLISGDTPYGTFPTRNGTPCGLKYADGTSQAYRQATRGGRCESPIELGDTYGPVNYAAYVPAVALLGWTGLWDDLPAAHFTSVLFDALCALGLLFAGRRLAGWRLGVSLAFAWAAYPFTAFALESNSNDMIVTAFAIWGFVWATSPVARGALLALASWSKFAPLALWPLWLRYPRDERTEQAEWEYGEVPEPLARGRLAALRERLWLGPRRSTLLAIGGLAVGTLPAALLLIPGGTDTPRAFWDATFGYQLSRPSPFSLWHWGIYPGLPDLRLVQAGLEVVFALAAVACLWVPRRLDAVRLAALSGALVIGFQLCLSYWFYTYIPWFFPFAMIALCAPSRVR
jgi:hypothetical protein